MRKSFQLVAVALRVAAANSYRWLWFLATLWLIGTVLRPLMHAASPVTTRAFLASGLAQALGCLLLAAAAPYVVRSRNAIAVYLAVAALSGVIASIAYAIIAAWQGMSGHTVDEAVVGVINTCALVVAVHMVFSVVRYMVHTAAVVSQRLRTAQQEVRALRASADATLQAEHERLAGEVQRTLGTNLADLMRLATSSGDAETEALVVRIQDAIQEGVRPLSRSILATSIDVPRRTFNLPGNSIARFPRRLQIAQILRPELLVILPLPVYLTTQYQMYGWPGVMPGLLANLLEYAVLKGVALLAPARPIKRASALSVVVLSPLMASLLGAIVIYPSVRVLLVPEPTFLQAYVREVGLSPILMFLLAYVLTVSANISAMRQQMYAFEREVNAEVVRQSQQMWAARQQWAYHIHGTVQGLLTAAMLLLQQPVVDWKQVRANVSLVQDSLRAAPALDLDVESVLRRLQESWTGTCEIRCVLSAEVSRALNPHQYALFTLNEVLKEAVSNAIRHSGSRHLDIALAVDAGTLRVSVTGEPSGDPESERYGLGKELYDHVSLEWSLQRNDFRMTLPIA